MLKKLSPYLALLLLTLMLGCSDDEDFGPALDENGLTTNITDLVPQAIIDEMLRLGMPINGGGNPPDLEGTYLGSRFVLKESNRLSDFVGQPFSDYRVTFYGQENSNLSIMVDYLNGPESGEGIGSFIVGDGCNFSVFVEVNSVTSGTDAKLVHVISGALEEDGIRELHLANFMVDNFGNPAGVWIENGEGRVIHDIDGFSERTDATNIQWFERLPDCPCEFNPQINETRESCGTWLSCGDASQAFHFGATYEIRWAPDEVGNYGQQCTYDANKKLITSGIAAGSPDIVSPGICGGLIDAVRNLQTVCDHVQEDVIPWGETPLTSAVCNLETRSVVPCWQYLRDWPTNQGNGCNALPNNPVSDIRHMSRLVGEMNCEKISYLMQNASESDDAAFALKEYLLKSGNGPSQTTESLVTMLNDWKRSEENATFDTDDKLILIINTAIANLE